MIDRHFNEKQVRSICHLRNKTSDNQAIKNTLKSIFKTSPVLSKILLEGVDVTTPFNTNGNRGVENPNFEGEDHPTFFDLKRSSKKAGTDKKVPLNQKAFQIQFVTDAVNDYFCREVDPGQFKLYDLISSSEIKYKSLNSNNGLYTLTVPVPENASEGDRFKYRAEVIDPLRYDPFVNEFSVVIDKEKKPSETTIPGNRKNGNKENGKGGEPSHGISLPDVIPVKADDWNRYGMTKESALIMRQDEDSIEMFVNMDNKYLLSELKGIKDASAINIKKEKYKAGLAIMGMAVMSHYQQQEKKSTESSDLSEEKEIPDVETAVAEISSILAPVMLPLIDSLSALEV